MATSIRDALEFCIKQGFDTVIVESDAKVLIQMIRKELTHKFSLECILGDIKDSRAWLGVGDFRICL